MLNALDIDPQNLEFDFGRDWLAFQNGRVCTFLIFFLQMQIGKLCRALEAAPTFEDVKELQGRISSLELKERRWTEELRQREQEIKEVRAQLADEQSNGSSLCSLEESEAFKSRLKELIVKINSRL